MPVSDESSCINLALAYIERDLRKYLGVALECTVLHARCEQCAQGFLVAYSCKRLVVNSGRYLLTLCSACLGLSGAGGVVAMKGGLFAAEKLEMAEAT